MIIMQLVGLVLLGALLYVGDGMFGVGIKRWLWNSTHGPRNRMTKDQEYGFIYGRFVRARLFTVATLAFLQLLIGFFVFHADLPGAILWSIIGVVFITGGTYLGPWFNKLLGMADVSLGHIEGMEQRVQRGETTVGAEFGRAADNVRDRVRETVTGTGSRSGSTVAPPAAPPEPPEPDGVASFDKYTKGRG